MNHELRPVARIIPLQSQPSVVTVNPDIKDVTQGEVALWRNHPCQCDGCWITDPGLNLFVDDEHRSYAVCSACLGHDPGPAFDKVLSETDYFKKPADVFSSWVMDRVQELKDTVPHAKMAPAESDAVLLLSLPALHPQRVQDLQGVEEYLRSVMPPPATGEHIGQPGERIELTVHVDAVESAGIGDWGEKFRVLMTTLPKKQVVVWQTGDNVPLVAGKTYRVSATVHKTHGHDVYRSVRRTKVQRVKILEEVIS
jgi:hypothetical protein